MHFGHAFSCITKMRFHNQLMRFHKTASYSEADFEVFRPAGATHCTDGVKFGTEEGTKFHPHRCNDKGIGPPKLNFFTEI